MNGLSQSPQTVKVSLNWTDTNQIRNLINSYDYPVNSDGTFQGTFQVPKLTSYYEASGYKFFLNFEYPNASINTLPVNIDFSDYSSITLDYIKQNLKLGDTQEQVKMKFGSQYIEYLSVLNGNKVWRYNYVSDKNYTFKGQYGDWEGLNSGRMKMQLFIDWTEEGTVGGFGIHYKGEDGKIYEYVKKPGLERDMPIEKKHLRIISKLEKSYIHPSYYSE